MSFLHWLLLGGTLALYLLFGGSVFMFIEQANEIHQQAELKLLRKDIQDILLGLDEQFYNNGTPPEVLEAVRHAKEGVILRISEACGGMNFLDLNSTQDAPLKWTLYNSVFYAFTAITTIGYGNLAPSTHWSRIFTIFYALIGIPINGVILTKISDMYNRKLRKVHNRAKATESRITFAFNVIFYLIPGLLLFIIIPAAFFVIIEHWGFLDAVYFCFVSLTTIGFGDIYPVAGMGDGHAVWLWVYKITIIFWIVFGLGYLVMILGFITKGITSKQVREALEKKLNRIRITREELAKDVDYMRKVVNELYLANAETGGFICANPSGDMTMDACSAYHQQYMFQRSKSFYIPRGSLSEEVDISLIRSFSESDLDRFSNRLETDADDGKKQCFLTQLVDSLHGGITEVLEAVEDFDNYEVRVNENESEQHSDRKTFVESSDFIHDDGKPNPTWPSSGVVDEIDEEILLNYDDVGRSSLAHLDEVVVHQFDSSTKPGGILEKVTGVLKKISSGSKSGSGPPSRKVSRNESEHKNLSFHVSEIQNQSVQESDLELSCQCSNKTTGIDHNCNVAPLPRNPSSSTFYGSDESSGIESGRTRRKISKAHGRSGLPRNLSLDQNALSDLMKVLDDVEERLADNECFPATCTNVEGASNYGFDASAESSPCHSPPRRRVTVVNRNRKLGIFNPEFKYFSPDLTGAASKGRVTVAVQAH